MSREDWSAAPAVTPARPFPHPGKSSALSTDARTTTFGSRLRTFVSRETTGGALLIGAAALALILANSPWRQAYFDLADLVVGPEAIGSLPVHLDLIVAHWASDGLLAIFFFVVGVELKHEFVAGSLRSLREAAVPMIAAVGGMVVPALVFAGVVLALGQPETLGGWAIPTATDIAFALAVLAVFGRGLPLAIRTFLLTLAVVDDLLAIIVIAVFYTETISWGYLGAALVVIAAFAWHVRSRQPRWWVLMALFAVAWVCMHASGVHATVAGVLMGFSVPARSVFGEPAPRTERYEHAVRPWSQGLALPVFAFFSAGVSLVDAGGVAEIVGQPVFLAISVGLVVGKVVGVLGTTALVTRATPLRLAQGIGVRDLLPVALLAGIGFTVALLVAELSFGYGSEYTDASKAAILAGSLLAALLGAATLRWDARRARTSDMNLDGVDDAVTEFIGDDRRREKA